MSDTSNYEFKWKEPSIKQKWLSFVRFGNSAGQDLMTGKNFDKWLKDSGIIDQKNITTTMTGISFSKVTGSRKKANFEETKQIIIEVAKDRSKASKRDVQVEIDDICAKLEKTDSPIINSAAKTSTSENVYQRLTDHSKYTGTHKERFDPEGKGKGKAGREDVRENTGYVSSYKNAGTWKDQSKG